MTNRIYCGVAAAAGAFALALPALAQPIPAQHYPYRSGPVTIASCTVNENKSNSTVSPNSLRINYFNSRPGSTLTSITFRVRYAGTPVTITDSGSFVAKQSVTHQFNQLGGLPWAGPRADICRVLTATFADGRVVNPPYSGPDAMPANPGAMEPPPSDNEGATPPADAGAPTGAPPAPGVTPTG